MRALTSKWLLSAGLLLFLCSPLTSLALSGDINFDIAEVGKVGRTTYTCVKVSSKNKSRLSKGAKVGRTISTAQAIKRIKRALTTVKNQIQELPRRKRARKIKKRNLLKKILKRARQCRKNTLLLRREDETGLAQINIPLSAIPDGVDPNTIGISQTIGTQAVTFLNALNTTMFDLEPDGLVLPEPVQVQVETTATIPDGQPGILTLASHISGAGTPEKPFIIEPIDIIDSEITEVSGRTSTAIYTLEISHFSKIGFKDAIIGDSVFGELVTPIKVTVGQPFQLETFVYHYHGSTLDEKKITLPNGEVIDVYTTTTKDPWDLSGKFKNDPSYISPVEVDNAPPFTSVASETYVFFKTFTCTKEIKERKEVIFYTAKIAVPAMIERSTDEQGEYIVVKDNFKQSGVMRIAAGLICEVEEDSSGGSGGDSGVDPDGETTDPEKPCKATGLFSISCPGAGKISYEYFAVFIDKIKGTPVAVQVADFLGNEINSSNPMCPGATTELMIISREDLSEENKKIFDNDSSNTPDREALYLKLKITGGEGEKDIRFKAYCLK